MRRNSKKSETARSGAGSTAGKKEKKPLKLSVPRTHKPEDLSLEEWQRILRKEYGILQDFTLKNVGDHPIFSDFRLTNPATGKTYNLIIRGRHPGVNYCSCPDFAVNNLGTCKHLEFAWSRLEKKRGARNYWPPVISRPIRRAISNTGSSRKFASSRDGPCPTLAGMGATIVR
ncbi:MAG: hypothetical protein HY892_05180 [Deltaproteobacteria bacterium]|nr:hypothetical protein [Deltaproteobacteria bacterium]